MGCSTALGHRPTGSPPDGVPPHTDPLGVLGELGLAEVAGEA